VRYPGDCLTISETLTVKQGAFFRNCPIDGRSCLCEKPCGYPGGIDDIPV